MSTTAEQLKSWLPVDAIIHEGSPSIVWMDFADVEFLEPFFHQTVARVEQEHNGDQLTTDFDVLLQHAKLFGGLEPSGLIFHSSRCGSTTLANACRSIEGSIVISEAPILDKLISRFFTDAPVGSPKELLYKVMVKSVANSLGQRRLGKEQRVFIKFAATSTLQMKRIMQIFPETPSVFMYRDPVEVMVSNLRSLPEWMNRDTNPGAAAAIAGVGENELEGMRDEEFCARALGRFHDEAYANLDKGLELLNYNQLTSDAIIEAVKFFGVKLSEAEDNAIRKSSRLYSKDITGTQLFTNDTESKKKSASPLIIEMARQWASTPYERLNSAL